ncbi:patatin-like phospholipase family protein [Sphingobium sp. TCM1]|uniref:patatin-like phospholipase family protein n=1 Tax=Sphingobium sp. TCM1 TaxID=453246 RepID=UPI0007F486D5|nr:patatin-like phospholipase family protein [Sphingobium sp. TCM1]OAN54212.1 hypothetical protein A7Q26_24270 [Sphingobium sp. TCM1]
MRPALRLCSTSLLSLLALAGCATMPARIPYSSADSIAASILPGEPVRFWAKGDDDAYRRRAAKVIADRGATPVDKPRTFLALSGGSDKGAFSAGLLNAWTRRGDRPAFDMVTGVSTGALIAPFAFLGSGQDTALTAIYTNVSAKDIYRKRILPGLLGGSGLLDTKPLQTLIARYITPDFLDLIAAEHRKGRRLLVMTTDLDAQRGVIWDMGAIAASASPRKLALFRQVLLASASIPGAFPPVLIDATVNGKHFAELHVDGGTISGFFLLPRDMMVDARADGSEGAIYILYNGRLAPKFEVSKPRTLSLVSRALSTVLGEADRTSIDDLRSFAQERKIRLSVCAIDEPDPDDDAALFDTEHMRKLYAMGEREGNAKNGCLASTRGTGPTR